MSFLERAREAFLADRDRREHNKLSVAAEYAKMWEKRIHAAVTKEFGTKLAGLISYESPACVTLEGVRFGLVEGIGGDELTLIGVLCPRCSVFAKASGQSATLVGIGLVLDLHDTLVHPKVPA